MLSPAPIPGPRPLPLLGGLGHAGRFVLDPLDYVGRLFERHGSIAALVQGKPVRLVSTDPNVPATLFVKGAALNHELLGNHDDFHKCAIPGPLWPGEPLTERTRPLTRMLTGLFHVNGDEHRAPRRLMLPAFYRKRIGSYRDDMVAITESVLASYAPGQVRDLRPDMNELTLRIASKTLFGSDLGDSGVQIGRDIQRWLELFRPAAIAPFDLPGLPYRRWLDTTLSVDASMRKLIAEKRRAAPRRRATCCRCWCRRPTRTAAR